MPRWFILTAALVAATLTSPLAAQPEPVQPDFRHLLATEGVDPDRAALRIVRLSDGQSWEWGAERVDQRFPPASTSKIPHTLIALETGFADPETHFEWDGEVRFVESWNQDQTLTTAYRRSAVWVYRHIAASLGGLVMSDWLERFDFGNAEIGGPDDLIRYWLVGPLEITAREQTAFLARLAQDELPVSAETMRQAREIMEADRGVTPAGEAWTLYAKTGWMHNGETVDIGWYVGWVERTDGPYVFAFNLDMPMDGDAALRIPAARAALSAVGAMPAPPEPAR